MMCGFMISAHAQGTALTLKNGGATVRRIIQPVKKNGRASLFSQTS